MQQFSSNYIHSWLFTKQNEAYKKNLNFYRIKEIFHANTTTMYLHRDAQVNYCVNAMFMFCTQSDTAIVYREVYSLTPTNNFTDANAKCAVKTALRIYCNFVHVGAILPQTIVTSIKLTRTHYQFNSISLLEVNKN